MYKSICGNKYVMASLIVVLGVLAYSNSFTVPFQFDDESYVVTNSIIRSFHYFFSPFDIFKIEKLSPTSLPPALQFAFMTRILGYFTLALNFKLHGLNVVGYHVVNLALHLFNGYLVYLIARSTLELKRCAPRGDDSRAGCPGAIAAATALLFVVHPMQTHAVTYITSRFLLLASCGYLLALFCYLKSQTEPAGKRALWYGLALASTVGSMLSKEFSFTLPFMVALYDFTFLDRELKQRLKSLAPFAATLCIIPILVFLQQGQLGALDSTMRTITAADVSKISRGDYLLTQFGVITDYLRLLFLPIHQNVDHDFTKYHTLFALPVFACFLLLVAIFLSGLYCYYLCGRRRDYPELRLAGFGILWFFVTLSVESSILPLGELGAEYRVYLPSFGLFLAVTALAHLAARVMLGTTAGIRLFVGLFGVLVLVLAVATFSRNRVWQTEISLWEDSAKNSPKKLRPHQNLGLYLSAAGRLDEAKKELSAALAIDPNNFELHNNLGIVYKKLGDYPNAIGEYTKASQLNPGDPMSIFNLANAYLAQGDLASALRYYEKCLQLIPDYDELHNNLAIVYLKSGRPADALREFERAVQLNPENANARRNLESVRSMTAGPGKN